MDNKLKLGFSSATSNKLELKGGEFINGGGLLNFDSSVTTYASYDISINLDGNAELSFNLYLDNSAGYNNDVTVLTSGAGGEGFSVFLKDSSIYIGCYILGRHWSYSIKDYSQQILSCQIKKNSATAQPTYFKINGVTQPSATDYIQISSSQTGTIMGGGATSATGLPTIKKLSNATIWNIKVNASSGNLAHWWQGYPNGNLDSAWVDSVGSLDLIANGTNITTRQDIPNYSGTYFSVPAANKLLLRYIVPIDYSTTLIVNSAGDGNGVASMRISTSAPLTLTLDENARFYTDAAGTLNESISVVMTGTSTIYIKNYGGAATLTFADKRLLTAAGSASTPNSGQTFWSFATTFANNVPIINMNNWDFPNCSNIAWFYGQYCTFTGAVTTLGTNLQKITVGSTGTVTGTTGDMSRVQTIFGISQNCNISGDVSLLPNTLEQLAFGIGNTVTGNVAGFPAPLWYLDLSGSNTVSGNIGDLPQYARQIIIGGLNTVSGDINALDASMTYLSMSGYNTVYGDISTLKPGLQTIDFSGYNTITGNIKYFPSSLTSITMGGSNSVYGDVSTLKSGLTIFYAVGNASTYGDIAFMPSTITTMVLGNNTLSGNISTLPSSLARFEISGANTLSGDVSTLKIGLNYSFSIYGYNTISGDINFMSAPVFNFQVYGINTIGGSLGTSLKNRTTIQRFEIVGANTISGDLANIPQNCLLLTLTGQNTVDTYTSGRTWVTGLQSLTFTPVAPGGLSSTEVDNLFIDLNNSGCTYSSGGISVKGTNAAPTATSLTARNALIGRGYSISTN